MLRLGIDPRDPTRSYPNDKSSTPEFRRVGLATRADGDFREIPSANGAKILNLDNYRRSRYQAEGAIVAFGFFGTALLIVAIYYAYCFLEQQEKDRLGNGPKDLQVKV